MSKLKLIGLALGAMLITGSAVLVAQAQSDAELVARTCAADFSRFCHGRVPLPAVKDFDANGPGGLASRKTLADCRRRAGARLCDKRLANSGRYALVVISG
jgi:hypothetical protein